MRLALLVLLLVAFAPLAVGQDDTAAPGNETPEANETPADGDATTVDANATDGNATEEPAAPTGPVAITILGHTEGSTFYWTLEGQSQRNPTINLPPNTEITVTVVSESGFHNFQVEGFPASQYVDTGQTTTYTFTTPASGSLQYWCVPHKGSGMAGRIVIGGSDAGGGGAPTGDGGEITGESVDLGSLGHSQCAGYMIPAIATRGVVGGPTVDDYVKRCEAGDQPVVTVREKHAADYVIPASLALIGLGVVGVVWAHRWYKP